jgi:short-subunit dehydrogenase
MARRAELLEELATKVKAGGGDAIALPCDVGDYPQVQAAMQTLHDRFGPIDCVIANAGIGQQVERLKFDPQATEQIFRTNVLGMTNAFYAALPKMLARKQGHLVGIASLASYQGLPEDAGYAASKAAMRIHCEGMRVELRGTGVKVTTICPGFIRTPLTDKNEFDMPALLEVDDAARRIVKAIAKQRRIQNFPKRLWWVVKLGRHTPRWLFDAVVGAKMKKMTGTRTQAYSTDRQAGN